MVRRIVLSGIAVLALALASGCSVNQATAKLAPGADLGRVKSVYVVKETGDDHAIDELMKAQLTKMGYDATAGAELPLPYKTDAFLTYRDKWMWDLTMYMLQLDVDVKDPQNGNTLATGHSLHTSLSRKTPEAMVEEVLTNVFRNAK